MTQFWNRIWYTPEGEPEDLSAPDAGERDIYNAGGSCTGAFVLDDLYFFFEEFKYVVFQHTLGDDPLASSIKEWPYGLNYDWTVKNIGGILYYLSSAGDIRRTNGMSDESISDKIRPLTKKILNGRTVKDYYSGNGGDVTPFAIHDKFNNAYRLFYAGESSNTNKAVSYFIDKDVWVTSSGLNFGAGCATYGLNPYIGIFGNSSANGNTYFLDPAYSDTSKTGTFDSGWMSAGSLTDSLKLNGIEIWYHAQAGETSDDDCSCTLTITVYDSPDSNTPANTVSATLSYNDTVDNLQRLPISVKGESTFLRIVITDSGTNKNYAIDQIEIDVETVEGGT